ncbi:hypothetical protein K8W59_19325 [Nocardioides rotundus]|uniref:hypothetical protein n=1 Tax=Nocardioides rotundus TaxID=1774216 RepID=UPI001CBED8BB|nr:hypothetical protein [Nocardioides rotundus]UAL29846.1 hypothetical protein K8W59_19325 [Nocardioides rotundus]
MALDLYEWNAEISAALLRDLAHLEVGLRNAYDRALSARWPGPPHWTTANIPAFAPLWRTRRGRRVDVNLRTRESPHRAVDSAGGPAAPPGKVIAELMFGFWRFLSSSAHEKSLWVPSLHQAFAPGTDRRDVDRPIGRLHGLRNRVAHHEPLLRYDITGRVTDIATVAGLLDPDLDRHLSATSRVTGSSFSAPAEHETDSSTPRWQRGLSQTARSEFLVRSSPARCPSRPTPWFGRTNPIGGAP